MVRFSGHETFPCRYSWIPKAYAALSDNPQLFKDETNAIVELGVGKNMVRAIRFWIRAAGILHDTNGLTPTDAGEAIFAAEGFDPYMEDIRTNWIIHWMISSIVEAPLFAWKYVFNNWHFPEFTRSELEKAFFNEASQLDRPLSQVTTDQHLDVFLRTYVARGVSENEAIEDSLDCPLAELNLIRVVGERFIEGTKQRELVYGFRYEEKDDIPQALFVYFLNDYWKKHRLNEKTISLNDLAYADMSPGQILKMPEQCLRQRLEHIFEDSNGIFMFDESTSMQSIIKMTDTDPIALLQEAYI